MFWDWSGPGGFSSAIQNPTNDTTWGTYQLIVTEKRNGCKDTAFSTVSILDFGVLPGRELNLSGHYRNHNIVLNWQNIGILSANHYEIQRSSAQEGFVTIGTVMHDSINHYYSFTDNAPLNNDNYYRIKCTTSSGLIFYSNSIDLKESLGYQTKYYLIQGDGIGKVSLACIVDKEESGTIVMYNVTGQVLASKKVHLYSGMNNLSLPLTSTLNHQVMFVSLFINSQLSFTQNAVF